mmetsp:Transcript_37170/g.86420  ORF Transcript_37170/g.86420 Transcript_37170/m.86420 type:complete len:296 (-) Transcript_37170:73-960(-)
MSHYLMSNLITLEQMVTDSLPGDALSDAHIASFLDSLEDLIKEHFGRMLRTVYFKMDPLLKACLDEQLEAIRTKKSCMDECENHYVDQITTMLQTVVHALQKGFLYLPVARVFLLQLMHHIDVILFNQLVDNREACTFSNAIRMKHVVSRFTIWARKSIGAWIFADDERRVELELDCPMTRQAADLLMIDKAVLADPQARSSVCSALTPIQIRALLDSYTPDEMAMDPIPGPILLSIDREIEKIRDKSTPILNPFKVPNLPAVAHVDPESIAQSKRAIPPTLKGKPRFKFLTLSS